MNHRPLTARRGIRWGPRRCPACSLACVSRSGKQKAAELFWRLGDAVIQRVGTLYGVPRGEFEDFAQDAWLAVFNALVGGNYNPGQGTLRDWLFVVIRNRAVTLFRRRLAHRRIVDWPLESLPAAVADDPVIALQRACDAQTLRNALRTLQQRVSRTAYAVFRMRRLEQASIRTVAAALNLTPVQVRVYDHRARRKLATILSRRDR